MENNTGMKKRESELPRLCEIGKEKWLCEIPFDKLYTLRLDDVENIAEDTPHIEVGFVLKKKIK